MLKMTLPTKLNGGGVLSEEFEFTGGGRNGEGNLRECVPRGEKTKPKKGMKHRYSGGGEREPRKIEKTKNGAGPRRLIRRGKGTKQVPSRKWSVGEVMGKGKKKNLKKEKRNNSVQLATKI